MHDNISEPSGIIALRQVFGTAAKNKRPRRLLANILKSQENSEDELGELATIIGADVNDLRETIIGMRTILESKADEYSVELDVMIEDMMDFIN